MRKFVTVIITLSLAVLSSCGSSSEGTGTSTVAVPDYPVLTQKVLPVMNSILPASDESTKLIWGSSTEWSSNPNYSYMINLALSTDTSAGLESVFNFVDAVKTIADEINAAGGFGYNSVDANNNTTFVACPNGTVNGHAFTGTALSTPSTVTLPFMGTSSYDKYVCKVNVTLSDKIYSYAFATTNTVNSDGTTTVNVSHLAIATNASGAASPYYSVMEGSYVEDTHALDVSFVSYVPTSTGGNPFAMKAIYTGNDEANTFTFQSTLRGPLTNCSPTATSADNEAKKLWAKGTSQGQTQGIDNVFLFKALRNCTGDVNPVFFCLDAVTKEQATDHSWCGDISEQVDAGTLTADLVSASNVPFTDTDVSNWVVE